MQLDDELLVQQGRTEGMKIHKVKLSRTVKVWLNIQNYLL